MGLYKVVQKSNASAQLLIQTHQQLFPTHLGYPLGAFLHQDYWSTLPFLTIPVAWQWQIINQGGELEKS